jgi:hypothetical protein
MILPTPETPDNVLETCIDLMMPDVRAGHALARDPRMPSNPFGRQNIVQMFATTDRERRSVSRRMAYDALTLASSDINDAVMAAIYADEDPRIARDMRRLIDSAQKLLAVARRQAEGLLDRPERATDVRAVVDGGNTIGMSVGVSDRPSGGSLKDEPLMGWEGVGR